MHALPRCANFLFATQAIVAQADAELKGVLDVAAPWWTATSLHDASQDDSVIAAVVEDIVARKAPAIIAARVDSASVASVESKLEESDELY